jgi:hypothetical protein
MAFSLCSTNHYDRTGFITTIAAAVLIIFSTGTMAQEEFFLPNTLLHGKNIQHPGFRNLNNLQLIERADELRSQDFNAAQRELNHQWVENYQNDKAVHGSKAFQTLLKRGLKEFWDRQRKERFQSKYVPDIDGRGSISGEMDYDLRFSSDALKFGLTYEF